ncbi:hypothetical protein Bca4012_102186 [Brassica carinata]
MDFNPFQDSAKFVELLNSQQNVVFGSQGSVSLSTTQAPFAWKELRADQKWCELSTAKNGSSSKKRKCEDENNASGDEEFTSRPPGVKASKARGKKPVVDGKVFSDFQNIWSLKKEDLAMKERLSKMRMLELILAKEAPLDETDDVLKKKLINELM